MKVSDHHRTGHGRTGGSARLLPRAAAAVVLAAGGFGPLAWGQGAGGAGAPPGSLGPPAADAAVNPALEPFENRLVREVRLVGLKEAPEQLVRNQVRTQAGQPLSSRVVQQDIQRINRLGRFREIDATVQPYDDGSVAVVYRMVETPVVKDVQVSGNRQVSDQDIATEVNILAGTPVDRFQIDRAARRIKDLYLRKGYYQADVVATEEPAGESDSEVNLVFVIREGERLRITDIRFEGNASFAGRQLRPATRTRTWGILDRGALDDVTLDQDVAALIQFYKDRGFLDARVDRRIQPAPNGREAIVTFIIEEGPRYVLRSVRVRLAGDGGMPREEEPTVFTQDQVAALMSIKAGDVYSLDKIRRSVQAVSDAYGKLGYVDSRVERAELRAPGRPEVDLLLLVTEGRRFATGMPIIVGNDLTQHKVIRRQVRVLPERPLDTTAVRDSERRLRELNLFAGNRGDGNPPRATVQPERPETPGYRDVLVEVEETNTGSLTFGAAVNSDAGLIGQFVINQRNFELTDLPDSFDEMVRGRAFRGGGQDFTLTIQPGTETQNYNASINEPFLFETNYSGQLAGGFRSREYDEYTENRLGGTAAIGRRFGTRWTGNILVRGEQIEIDDLETDAPNDLRDVEGDNFITAVGVRLRRSTVDSAIRPTKGSRLDLQAERFGLIGGDFEFTRLSGSYSLFVTVHEDFLGRKTILQLRTAAGYIPEGEGEAPIFERFFLGGRDFRGFRFRTVSPKGLVGTRQGEDPVGGTWSFFNGAQIEQPVFQDILSVVGFIDSGTVTNDVGLDQYRVAVGTGLRLYIPQLGPAPLAFDFAFPLAKEDLDRRRVFSFSLDIPF